MNKTEVFKMKKRIFYLIMTLLSLITLNSCVFATTGESLEAFSNRMNELNEGYNMTSDGYIIDTENCRLTKFFKFSENEMMLNFKYDKKHRLTEMNIAFDPDILNENPDVLTFIEGCIKCFVDNENAETEILNSTDFNNSITEINMKTISAEADNIKIEIDTTQLGTVITVYKDVV